MSGPGLFYIADLRPEWVRRPCVTFWRPDFAGYAYPLSWSGRYDLATVLARWDYLTKQDNRWAIRFPISCEIVDAMAVATPPKIVDGDAGPVVLNTAANRAALRADRYVCTNRAVAR
ncbi:hypothetical protein GGC47_003146 [Bosea sp. OAE752]|uniref:hypothetical protein n=1 Tax=Bosea sp. OAE752 TaxID=2663873 RepID=UPI003D22151A